MFNKIKLKLKEVKQNYEIQKLKNKAIKIKKKLNSLCINAGHSGGSSMAGMLNPEIRFLENDFDSIVKKLKRIDPNFPKDK